MRVRTANLPSDLESIETVLNGAAVRDGFPALSEEAQVALVEGSGRAGWLAGEGDRDHAFAHRRMHRGGAVIELVAPGGDPSAAITALMNRIRDDEPATELRIWCTGEEAAGAIARAGGRPERRLVRLQRSLPAGRAEPADGIRIVGFRPGLDVGAYLIVANDAFGDHPDSGAWTTETFSERAGRPWFDPGGLFLAWERGTPIAACWTKVHEGGIGEIYSIAVRPSAAGKGLGRAMVLTGFDYLAGERGITVGMLWVDRANDAAVRLYRRLGMEPVRERVELLLGT